MAAKIQPKAQTSNKIARYGTLFNIAHYIAIHVAISQESPYTCIWDLAYHPPAGRFNLNVWRVVVTVAHCVNSQRISYNWPPCCAALTTNRTHRPTTSTVAKQHMSTLCQWEIDYDHQIVARGNLNIPFGEVSRVWYNCLLLTAAYTVFHLPDQAWAVYIVF